MAEFNKRMLAPIRLSDDHRKWLEAESERTCNPFASIIRGLIQEKIAAELNAHLTKEALI